MDTQSQMFLWPSLFTSFLSSIPLWSRQSRIVLITEHQVDCSGVKVYSMPGQWLTTIDIYTNTRIQTTQKIQTRNNRHCLSDSMPFLLLFAQNSVFFNLWMYVLSNCTVLFSINKQLIIIFTVCLLLHESVPTSKAPVRHIVSVLAAPFWTTHLDAELCSTGWMWWVIIVFYLTVALTQHELTYQCWC